MSTLLFSDSEYKVEQEVKKSNLNKIIIIDTPARKNEFTKRKKWLFDNFTKDNFLEPYYETAKEILFKSADEYVRITNKSKNSLFKFRGFDKEYIKPQIEKYLNDRFL